MKKITQNNSVKLSLCNFFLYPLVEENRFNLRALLKYLRSGLIFARINLRELVSFAKIIPREKSQNRPFAKINPREMLFLILKFSNVF